MIFKKSNVSVTKLYILIVLLLTFCKAIALSGNSPVYQFTFAVCVFLWLVKIFFDNWSRKEIIVLASIGLTIVLNFLVTGKETLFVSFLLFSGMKGIKLRQVFKLTLITRTIGFIMVIMCVLLGLIENSTTLFWRNGEFIVRNDFGFGHPNLFHSSYFLIVLLYLSLYGKKYLHLKIIVIGFLNQVIYSLSASRTSYLIIIILLCFFYFEKFNLFRKIIKTMVPHLQTSLFVITLILAKYLNQTSIYKLLDSVLTGRLTYSTQQLVYFPNLFGHNFSSDNILFDNSYSMLLSMYGLFVTFFFLYGYYMTAMYHKTLNNYTVIIILIMTSLLFFTESYLPNALMNYSIYIIGDVFFNKRTSKVNLK